MKCGVLLTVFLSPCEGQASEETKQMLETSGNVEGLATLGELRKQIGEGLPVISAAEILVLGSTAT